MPREWKSLLLVALAILAPSGNAGASLITYEVEARVVQGATPPGSFQADTGLLPFLPFTWTGRFTIDTTVPLAAGDLQSNARYLFDQPDTEFVVTIGDLTLSPNAFYIHLDRLGNCDRFGIARAGGNNEGAFAHLGFQSNYCHPSGEQLPDLSLDSFVSAPPEFFGGSTFSSVITHNNWQILGNVNGIRRVPEPSTAALILFGALLALFMQRAQYVRGVACQAAPGGVRTLAA